MNDKNVILIYKHLIFVNVQTKVDFFLMYRTLHIYNVLLSVKSVGENDFRNLFITFCVYELVKRKELKF